jgi:hypothetical protein
MATVITAGNATNGLSLSADNFGTFEFKTGTGAGTTALSIDASQVVTFAGAASVPGNLSFNSGYGSAAVAYGCRAWVNFNGTGTVAMRSNGNVSSITDNGTGDYTVNFTTAMPDANYCHNITTSFSESSYTPLNNRSYSSCTKASSSLRFVTGYVSSTVGALVAEDTASVQVAIFR